MPDRHCDLCHDALTASDRGLLCERCDWWDRYWNGLTPAQRREEIQAMADYCEEMAAEEQRVQAETERLRAERAAKRAVR